MSPTTLVIIGMGVASIAAVEAVRSYDSTPEVTLISKDTHGYYKCQDWRISCQTRSPSQT
jgi:NADH dehydrogenase FAD-containing subunit